MIVESPLWVYPDRFGRNVRVSEDGRSRIVAHPEMVELLGAIEQVLVVPEKVIRSRTDSATEYFYRWMPNTPVGPRWFCAVVKYSEGDAFVVTAYLTDKPKAGEQKWPK